MPTYKEIFMNEYANNRGNIRKGVKAETVWQSVNEAIVLILEAIKKKDAIKRNSKKTKSK